MTVEEALHR